MADSLEKLRSSFNVAADLSEEQLSRVGGLVMDGLNIDESSRSEWKSITDESLEIARQVRQEKSTPFPNSANIKYPLITMASIQFAARAYPEIVKGIEIVKGTVVGYDPDKSKEQRAERVGKHMSWQLLYEMEEWDEETDQLLHILPVMGIVWRKTYFDPSLKRNVSRIVTPDLMVVNANATTVESIRRMSHLVKYYKNDVLGRQAAQLWLPVDLALSPKDGDEQAPHEFVEQHCWFDLDEDGFEEPYGVLVHKESKRVMRIVPRWEESGVVRSERNGKLVSITPNQYFTAYKFMPDPGGKFYPMGFGQLLLPINSTINTTVNQLLDAGKLANIQGGFKDSSVRARGSSDMRIAPGEWKEVEVTGNKTLAECLMPLIYREPSRVLFELLGFMNDAGRQLSSVAEVLTGEQPGANVPATTTLAMIEQGLKVFSAIHKRVYRSLRSEFKKIFKLNSIYLDNEQYFRVLDGKQQQAFQSDYDINSCDVYPVADPAESTDIQRYARAEAIKQTIGMPGVDPFEATRRYLVGIKMEEVDKLQPPPDPNNPPQPPPDPKMIEVQQRGQLEAQQFQMQSQLEQAKMQMEGEMSQARMQMEQQKFQAEQQIQMQRMQIEEERMAMTEKLNQAKSLKAAEEQEGREQRARDLHEWDIVLKQERADLEKDKLREEIRLLRAQTIVTLAKAEATEAGKQMDLYKTWAETLIEPDDSVSQASTQSVSETPPIGMENEDGYGSGVAGSLQDLAGGASYQDFSGNVGDAAQSDLERTAAQAGQLEPNSIDGGLQPGM